ncbi:MAG: prepilin peptidase [Desulfovibrionaceae bacterium]
MDATIIILLGCALAAATITDLRAQRIPNTITFGLAAASLAWHGWTGHLDGFLFSLGGLGVGFGCIILPYALGVMGAGDVKLMAAVGAALGPAGALWSFLLTSVAGGLYALAVLAARREEARRVYDGCRRFVAMTAMTAMTRTVCDIAPPRIVSGLPRLCYGVAIAVGTLAYLVWQTLAGVAGLAA